MLGNLRELPECTLQHTPSCQLARDEFCSAPHALVHRAPPIRQLHALALRVQAEVLFLYGQQSTRRVRGRATHFTGVRLGQRPRTCHGIGDGIVDRQRTAAGDDQSLAAVVHGDCIRHSAHAVATPTNVRLRKTAKPRSTGIAQRCTHLSFAQLAYRTSVSRKPAFCRKAVSLHMQLSPLMRGWEPQCVQQRTQQHTAS